MCVKRRKLPKSARPAGPQQPIVQVGELETSANARRFPVMKMVAWIFISIFITIQAPASRSPSNTDRIDDVEPKQGSYKTSETIKWQDFYNIRLLLPHISILILPASISPSNTDRIDDVEPKQGSNKTSETIKWQVWMSNIINSLKSTSLPAHRKLSAQVHDAVHDQ